MASNRIGRINEEIQKELSALFRTLKDPRVSATGMVSITRVDTTGDLRYARVYISCLNKEHEKDVMKGLKSASGYLRRELGRALSLRYTPELQFLADDSIQYGAHILEVLRTVEREDEAKNKPRTVELDEAVELLRGMDNVLILTHVRPDGDTVGCAAGLCAALRALGKTAYLLPNPELTETCRPYFEPYAAPEDFAPDAVVSTDIATPGLLPENAKAYLGRIDLALDHHPSFQSFARCNHARPEAAACGELIYDVVRALNVMTEDVALALYLAISTDTGGFIYNNTTAHTHAVAAALMELLPLHLCQQINKTFFRTKSFRRLQLESTMVEEAEFCDLDRVVFLSVPMSLMEELEATETDAEDLSSLGPQIEGVDCAVTMRELRPDVWKISLRSNTRRVNATNICAALGGGGHAAAAGCTVEGDYETARDAVLDAIAENVADFVE